ncbi:TPA: phage tail protein, partial [Enterococcus faecium]|nr:phage tail protein [Enterococcus faecium]
GDKSLTILNTLAATIVVDTQLGKAIQEGLNLFTRGDWPVLQPEWNQVKISGKFKEVRFWNRSVYL